MKTQEEVREMAEPAQADKFPARPKSFWLHISNLLCKKDGQLQISLQIDGEEKFVYDGYVIDGNICHSHNLKFFTERAWEDGHASRDQECKELRASLENEMKGRAYWFNYFQKCQTERDTARERIGKLEEALEEAVLAIEALMTTQKDKG